MATKWLQPWNSTDKRVNKHRFPEPMACTRGRISMEPLPGYVQVDQHQPEDLYTEKPIDPLPQHRYPTRSKGPAEKSLPFKDGRTLVNTALKSVHAKTIDKYGNPARDAVMNELRQLIKLKVLKLLQPDLLDPTTLKGILPSKRFVKPKFDPDGEFDKIKARL
eukprot:gene38455-51958_t